MAWARSVSLLKVMLLLQSTMLITYRMRKMISLIAYPWANSDSILMILTCSKPA